MEDMNWWQVVLSYVLPPVITAFGGVLTWAIMRGMKKLGIEVDASKDAVLRAAVRNAAAGAEEWAMSKLKIDRRNRVNGAEKMAWVLRRLREKYDYAPDDLEDIVLEELAQMKGMGATSNRAVGFDPEVVPVEPGDEQMGLI